jgi:hypothetical protein
VPWRVVSHRRACASAKHESVGAAGSDEECHRTVRQMPGNQAPAEIKGYVHDEYSVALA